MGVQGFTVSELGATGSKAISVIPVSKESERSLPSPEDCVLIGVCMCVRVYLSLSTCITQQLTVYRTF
jgi:hypothetical protein